MSDVDHVLFHTPFCKMTKKAIGRMHLADYLNTPDGDGMDKNNNDNDNPLHKFKGIMLESTFNDPALLKDVEKVSVQCSGEVCS